MPLFRATVTMTVGLPRESRISRAWILDMDAIGRRGGRDLRRQSKGGIRKAAAEAGSRRCRDHRRSSGPRSSPALPGRSRLWVSWEKLENGPLPPARQELTAERSIASGHGPGVIGPRLAPKAGYPHRGRADPIAVSMLADLFARVQRKNGPPMKGATVRPAADAARSIVMRRDLRWKGAGPDNG